MLCNGPNTKISEESRQGGRLVVGIYSAGVGQDPCPATAEERLLKADVRIFDAGDDPVGVDADERGNSRSPAFNFGLEALTAGAKLIVGEFIGAGGGALDDVGDAEFEIEKKSFFKGREKSRREPAAV